MTDTPRWPQPWVRALLETAVLGILAHAPAHGYAIAADLEDAGLGRLRGGSLYPLLARLEEGGVVSTTWQPGDGGPGRRLYAITPDGRERLRTDVVAWRDLVDLVTTLGPDDGPAHPDEPGRPGAPGDRGPTHPTAKEHR